MSRRLIYVGMECLLLLLLLGATGPVLAADEQCILCHQALTPDQVTEWRSSKHAESLDTLKNAPDAADDCAQCHSADFRSGEVATLANAQIPNSCSVCHLDHGAEGRPAGDKTTHELRGPTNKICVDCHSAQGAQPGTVPRSAQVEIFLGKGGAEVAESPGIHSQIMLDGCVTCHLTKHTFEADMGVCTQCHANLDEKQTLRAGIESQLEELLRLLDTYPDKESTEYQEAKFDIDLVQISGDNGAHNYSYSKALLDYSESVLKGVPTEPQPKEETCFTCHRALTPNQVASWEGSAHAKSLTTIQENPNAADDCLRCHSLDYRQDPQNVTLETAALPNSCGTCHIDHITQGTDPGLLAAKKEMCVDCHTAVGVQPGETPPSSQREIFLGTGGVGVDPIPGTHSMIMQDGCVSCHHTEVDGVTDHTFQVDFSFCSSCHEDGLYEGKKAEIVALIGQADLLIASADTATDAYRDAKYDYDLVTRSRDNGAHNFKYSKALLEKSIELLTPTEPEIPGWDTNRDGVVDVQDLVVVGRNFGLTLEAPMDPNPDVNGDGSVDIQDLVLIGLHFGEETLAVPAAPVLVAAPASRIWLETTRNIEGQLLVQVRATLGAEVAGYQFDLQYDPTQLQLVSQSRGDLFPTSELYWRNGDAGRGYLRAVAAVGLRHEGTLTRQATLGTFLFQQSGAEAGTEASTPAVRLTQSMLVGADGLLPHQVVYVPQSISVPAASRLLANYPNPFNPETWIPYELAETADVSVSIYDATGQLVREIEVGYRPAGYHLDRQEAIYWDGRTDSGERAASGVYYYRLRAGDFTDVRKMVVLK